MRVSTRVPLKKMLKSVEYHGKNALRSMLARFSRRFRYIEARAREQNRALEEMSLAEMDAFWDEAKRLDKEQRGG